MQSRKPRAALSPVCLSLVSASVCVAAMSINGLSAKWRIAFGFIVAPVAPCFMLAFALQAISEPGLTLRGVLGTFYFALLFAEPFGIVLGVPAFLVVRRFRSVGLLECVVCGALVGLPVGLLGLTTGALSGLSFWALALKRPRSKS